MNDRNNSQRIRRERTVRARRAATQKGSRAGYRDDETAFDLRSER